jgi:hypothetical protein
MKYDPNINVLHSSGNGYLNIDTLSYTDGFFKLSSDQPIVDYYNRAGITDLDAKNNISDFYLGLKKLNLLDNTINFYLLKSGYNQVTGSTVYGFKTGYDGFLPNLDQTIWTSTGIFLKSGFATPNSSFNWECSGKGVIIHKAFGDLLEGNSTIVMLGKTNISNTEHGYGTWWHQTDRSAGQRTIWHNPNGYYTCNEFMFGSGGPSDALTSNNSCPSLSTGQQYNIISYSNKFYPSLYNQYSGSGFITIYKDSNLVSSSQLTGVVLPRLCNTWPYYPCEVYSGFIGGIIDIFNGTKLGPRNNSYIVFAGAFSKTLAHAEHSGLNNLILNTIAKNISLG